MKCALLVEPDAASRRQAAGLLKTLGYVVATADNHASALQAAQAVRVLVVLACATIAGADRRSFAGELARLAPGAPVVLMLDAAANAPPGLDRATSLLVKPVTPRALRRVLEFGIDGYGMLPSRPPWTHERRRQPQRRARPR